MAALIVLLCQLQRDPRRTPPIAGSLERCLGPLKQLEHVVVTSRPARRTRQALKVGWRKRIAGIGRAQQLIGTLPLPSSECLSTSIERIPRDGVHTTRLLHPMGELPQFSTRTAPMARVSVAGELSGRQAPSAGN